jgi:glycosyltransferase involved in cell wall biosynthesis
MRIVIISTLAVGGAATAAHNIQKALSQIGHTVSFYSLERNSFDWCIPLAGASAANNSYRPSRDNFDALFNHWSEITIPKKMQAGACELFSDCTTTLGYLSEEAESAIAEAEIVHLQWISGLWPSPALLTALAGKKVFITLHDMNPFTGGCHYHLTCRNFEAECGNCPCLKQAADFDLSYQNWLLKAQIYQYLNPVIIAPSQWLSNLAKQSSLFGAYPVHTIIHPQDLNAFRALPQAERDALRLKNGFTAQDILILAGAQDITNKGKNIKTLLAGLAALYVAGIRFTLLLFGHGEIRRQIYPVRHMGPVDLERLQYIYNMADIFINPSEWESLSLTLCEAQCCGTPVMSFAAGGTIDTFANNYSGFLVETMTSQALADRLAPLLQNPSRLREMRPQVRALAETRFAPLLIARQYENIFNSVSQTALPQLPDKLSTRLLQNYSKSMFSINYQRRRIKFFVRSWLKNTLLLHRSEKLWRPIQQKLKKL